MYPRPRPPSPRTPTGDTIDAIDAAEQAARLATVRDDLAWITQNLPDLHQLRLPGARRRLTRRALSPTARAALDRLTRDERADRRPGERILGASPAPVAVAILDDLSEILADAVELADRISWNAGVVDIEPPSTGYDFRAMGRHLTHIAEHLPAAAATDPDALALAQHFATRARRTLERSLEEAVDGQVLSTLCAWCHGTTTLAPAGGQNTLTVRVVAGEPLIVCTSDVCEPPPEDCGTWFRGRPAWRDAEWDWLARRLGPGTAAPRVGSHTSPDQAVRDLLAALRQKSEHQPDVLGGILDDERDGAA
ncbi:hypothetical protein ACFXKD_27735 [Nocardiopsis aegyptia]|uniref:hypothetical protein n=1 Tax=Nocardiopsis aegyptia TaxID=220378 RepID=UPI00366F4390